LFLRSRGCRAIAELEVLNGHGAGPERRPDKPIQANAPLPQTGAAQIRRGQNLLALAIG
jgi:hypothetical protein